MADWIKPGAEVVVYKTGRDDKLVRRATVEKVATKSFVVEGFEDRFSLSHLETKNVGAGFSGWQYSVTQVGSPKHKALTFKDQVDAMRAAAAKAVDAASRGYFVDAAAIDAASKTLARLHELLTSNPA